MATTQTVRRIVSESREQDIMFKAAGISFYALTSMIPLLVVALAVLSTVGAAGTLVAAIRSSVSGTVADLVGQTLQESRFHGVAGGIGLVFTVWSASKIFRGLSVAFGDLYPQSVDDSLVARLAKSLTVFVLILLAVAVLSVSGVALGYLPFEIPYPRVLGRTLAAVALVAGLLPLYYVLPPEAMTVRRALPGAAVAAVGWLVLQVGFSYYVRNAASYAAYGILGTLVLFITFLYVAAIILLVGAAVNVIVGR